MRIPKHGDFLRPRPSGNTHIAMTVYVTPGSQAARVEMACGRVWTTYVLDPVGVEPGDDPPRPCHACWEAM